MAVATLHDLFVYDLSMMLQAERRRLLATDSGSDYDWTGIGPDEAIAPSRFATWVFHYEDRGERIKR